MVVQDIPSSVSLEAASLGYRSDQPLLEGIDLTAAAGEMIALVGRNGSGKSTLLRSILGLIPLMGGLCRIQGTPVQGFDSRERARQVSFVASGVEHAAVTVRELVALGRIPYTGWTGRPGERDRAAVEQAIREVGLMPYMDRGMDQLSDGERQRVMIARAMAQDTPLMLLDEPTAYLDVPHRFELVRLLAGFRDRGKTIIFSTHDLELAMMAADRFWVIHEGQVHEGAPEDLGLTGLFDELFRDAGIGFDPLSGRFRYLVERRGRISLNGPEGPVLTWTRLALERLGYSVGEGDITTRVMAITSAGGCHWHVERRGNTSSFDSLHALARFLKLHD